MRCSCALFLLAAFSASCGIVHSAAIATIPIGNPGNPADPWSVDPSRQNGVGSVSYAFEIAKTEVTNAQYVEFLNAVAASDPNGAYNVGMSTFQTGGIVRVGTAGNYTYSVKAPAIGQGPGGTNYTYDNKPATYVSWYEALRFCNWLHNGQPHGAEDASTTEGGAYTFSGATTVGPRNPGARWWLPNEDEWYKAAYYNPATNVYYLYPTGTNIEPNNHQPSTDTGNSANFAYALSARYPFTDAAAYTRTKSPYGTFDQGGNAYEWDETLLTAGLPGYRGGTNPGFQGGGYSGLVTDLGAGAFGVWHNGNPSAQSAAIGFRVATVGSIPEPATGLLIVFGIVALCVVSWPACYSGSKRRIELW